MPAPKIVLAGENRLKVLLETMPLLEGRARGFLTEPVLDGPETVGYKLKAIGGAEGVVADARAESGPKWKNFRIQVAKIDEIATAALREPLPEDGVFIMDEVSEMILYSRDLQMELKTIYKGDNPFVATVGDKPEQYMIQLKRMRGVEALYVGNMNVGQVTLHVRNALGLEQPTAAPSEGSAPEEGQEEQESKGAWG